jgi:protein phosphatase
MTDRWYYTHAGKRFGPVTAAQLRELAAAGRLEPSDLIWPEGKDQGQAAPAQAAIEFSSPVVPLDHAPDWLNDVRAALEKPPPAPSATPDWLEDVRETEELLNFPWDNEAATIEEEAAEELLRDPSDEPPPAAPKPAASVPLATPVSAASGPVPLAMPVSTAPGPALPSCSCRLILGSATTRGKVRERNEDSLLVQQCSWSNLDQRQDLALIVVADGMGGHNAGDRASKLVIHAMSGVLPALLNATLSGQTPSASPAEVLEKGLQEANRIVRQAAQDNAACKGMGSTAVALLLWGDRAFIALVGDCRVYHSRAGKLTQITRDQTLVARMVELGQLTPEEAEKHPRRNEVSQAIGKYALVEPAAYDVALTKGDWLVASCDGLYAHVTERMIQDAIAKAGSSAVVLADRLVELANQGGGSDNCTVVAVHCG